MSAAAAAGVQAPTSGGWPPMTKKRASYWLIGIALARRLRRSPARRQHPGQPAQRQGRGGQPLGGLDARVGDDLATTALQLREDPADSQLHAASRPARGERAAPSADTGAVELET